MILGLIGIILTIKFPFGFSFYFAITLFLIGLLGTLVYLTLIWFRKSILGKVLVVISLVLTLAIASIVVISQIDYRILLPAVSSETLTKEEWISDFDFLQSSLSSHPAFNDSLEVALDNYETQIKSSPQLSDCDALLIAMKMVALFEDGHSDLIPFQLYTKARYLPIQIFNFEDGWFITKSTKEEIIGAEILAINDTKIDTVSKMMAPLIGSDNSFFKKHQSSLYMPNIHMLQCLGITSSESEASLQLLIDDEMKTVNLESTSLIQWVIWSLAPDNDPRPVGHNLRNLDPEIKLENDTLLWMTFNKTGPETILTEIGNAITRKSYGDQVNHLVIDMRNNTGGDNTTYNDLVKSLTNSENEISILTSRKTFSAGINFISELKLVRDFKIIGEPTGAGHNHYGDPKTLFLPNSGFMLTLSTREWSFIPQEKEKSINPDIQVRYYSKDYFMNKDPWIKALDLY
uniref:hypothetical protein n=1 Tax=Ekhidna sp. TaxID=2608089 RepID=UPI0032EE5F41